MCIRDRQNIVNEVVNNLKPLIDKIDYPKILMVGLGTVSYTHLDVYKRQK